MKRKYSTLSEVRADNPQRFDKLIKEAVSQAFKDVGHAVVIRALCCSSNEKAR